MVDRGIPDELFEHFAGRLEWHRPWHQQRELSLLFRGKVDVDEAEPAARRARPHGPAADRQRRDLRADGGDRGPGARLPPAPGGGEQGERGRLPHARPRLRARGVHRDRRLGRGPRRRRGRRPLLRPRQRPRARPRAARGDRRPRRTSPSPRGGWARASTRRSSLPWPAPDEDDPRHPDRSPAPAGGRSSTCSPTTPTTTAFRGSAAPSCSARASRRRTASGRCAGSSLRPLRPSKRRSPHYERPTRLDYLIVQAQRARSSTRAARSSLAPEDGADAAWTGARPSASRRR